MRSRAPCLGDPYCPEWCCCSPDSGDRGTERSKRKSPAKRRFLVPISLGKMGTICKGDRSIPRSPGAPRPRQDALEHIHIYIYYGRKLSYYGFPGYNVVYTHGFVLIDHSTALTPHK